MRWEVGGCIAVVLGDVASRMSVPDCMQHSCVFFSRRDFLASMQWIHIVLTHIQVGRNLVLFYRIDSHFHMIDNLSIESHAFTRRISTSLSLDEMLLLRYMNWSTNFRGLDRGYNSFDL